MASREGEIMLLTVIPENKYSVADLGFPEEGRQHTISPKFPKNCMKLKEFGPQGGARPKFYYVDPPLVLAMRE